MIFEEFRKMWLHPEQSRADAVVRVDDESGQQPDSAELSRTILRCASRELSKIDFLNEVSQALLRRWSCDAVEIRLSHGNLHYRWETARRPVPRSHLEPANWVSAPDGTVIPASHDRTDLEQVCYDVAAQHFDAAQPFFTPNGSFWTADAWERVLLAPSAEPGAAPKTLCIGGHYRSLAVVRFVVDDTTLGLLHIKSEAPNSVRKEDVEFCEGIAQTLGLALADWRAQYALRERVKELTCLYGIAQAAESLDAPLEETIGRVVGLLPAAWQYPEIAAARITLDGRAYTSPGYRSSLWQQSAEVRIGRQRRGAVEVVYLEERPEFAAGAFLQEENNLIAAVAREVALIVERREAEMERAHLQQQLIHADRLATIGELAAGVAHELNEPLSSILGFAQLAQKCPGLPPDAARDIEKIVTGSLYAREVVRKLMVFARQVPARKARVNLNQVVEDALYFLEVRCQKAGARVVRELATGLPELDADASQLKQVLVNLIVNALQAMPTGGVLTIGTRATGSTVTLSVADTGAGISEEIMGKIFLPFFTTKDVSEGTGLGLPVVHGIVSAHGGAIDVQSQPGDGARFEIRLPAAGCERPQEIARDG